MTKVGKSDGEGTFAGGRGIDEVARFGHLHRHPPPQTEDNRLTAFSNREVMFFLI
jgi:hypothetical protein